MVKKEDLKDFLKFLIKEYDNLPVNNFNQDYLIEKYLKQTYKVGCLVTVKPTSNLIYAGHVFKCLGLKGVHQVAEGVYEKQYIIDLSNSPERYNEVYIWEKDLIFNDK